MHASAPSSQVEIDGARNLSDDLAKARTRLAAERTLMAWIRTGLSMVSFGFGIDKIVESMRSSEVSFVVRLESFVRWFGVGIILLGIYALWGSLGEYRRTLRTITAGTVGYDGGPSVASTVARWLIVIGCFALISVVWSFFR